MNYISNITAHEMICKAMTICAKGSPKLLEFGIAESMEVEYMGLCISPNAVVYSPVEVLNFGLERAVACINEMYFDYLKMTVPLCSFGEGLSDTPTMQ